jgi:hypothetical protein
MKRITRIGMGLLMLAAVCIGSTSAKVIAPPNWAPGHYVYYDPVTYNVIGPFDVLCNGASYGWGTRTGNVEFRPYDCPPPVSAY